MADTVKSTNPIWVFGAKQDFKIYDCGTVLNAVQIDTTRRQKNQVVMHFTAGNGPAAGTVGWWNIMATHFFCPKWPKHDFHSATAGDCPDGHGALVPPPKFASAHYVVERARDRADAGRAYVDVIECADSDFTTWHGESVNNNSIGIEHANVGPGFTLTNDDTFTGAGANRRPTDHNHWLHLDSPTYPGSNLSSHDFQAYQEEQYLAMILLLRYLCIKHRIARRFLGDTTGEKFARWHNRGALIRSKLMRFRGILAHMNCHDTKECGGPALHRNRLFRGIIDEWWLPVQIDGSERSYHMGPFDPQTDTASFFRWSGGSLHAELFHDCDIDALQQTTSYFDFDDLAFYYAQTEIVTVGGFYPIGTNRIWHGGVHFKPPDANRKIYAAASGTIVAARLGSDAAIESDKEYGSQRFVLVRHCVYWQQEPDPGGGQRTNYTVDPTYFFTLYMHLAPVAKIDGVDDNNPPWLNYWLRRNAGGDATKVFCPNVPVSVGDWLGQCGLFRGQQMLHFEVLSKQELTVAPWDDPSYRIYDADANIICDSAAIDKFVKDKLNDGIDTLDILRAAQDLRKVKSYHKSEWALADDSALQPVLPDAASRKAKWDKIKSFMWVADAVAACTDLSTQLCDATGMMWHYHPVAFMEFVNRLVLRENGQVSEPDFKQTNVEMQDAFLTNYVNFTSGSAVPAAADTTVVKPFDVSDAHFQYHFARKDLACLAPVTATSPHDPADNPPKATHFHIALLDVLEDIRESSGLGLAIKLSHVCGGHNVAANAALCVLNTATFLGAHASGLAVDIRPSSATQANVKKLWAEAKAAAARFKTECGDSGGTPSHADLQGNVQSVDVLTDPGVASTLDANGTLSATDVANFAIHLQLEERARTVRWVAILVAGTMATSVQVSTSNVIGNFPSKMFADRERAKGTQEPWQTGPNEWQAIVKTKSLATGGDVRAPNLVGYYDNVVDAETEKISGNAWPEEY